MTETYNKPVPQITKINRPYWEAAKQHKFMLQRCKMCGSYRYNPGESCPSCLSEELEWVEVSGQGTIYSWTVFHHVYHPAFKDEVPYVVVSVELEEGPMINSRLVDYKIEDIKIGLPVMVTFQDVTDEITLPMFRVIV